MITHRQWTRFCDDLRAVKALTGEVYLKSDRVYEIDLTNFVVKTLRSNVVSPTITRYTFTESVQDYNRLRDLYACVTVTTSLDKLLRVSRDLDGGQSLMENVLVE